MLAQPFNAGVFGYRYFHFLKRKEATPKIQVVIKSMNKTIFIIVEKSMIIPSVNSNYTIKMCYMWVSIIIMNEVKSSVKPFFSLRTSPKIPRIKPYWTVCRAFILLMKVQVQWLVVIAKRSEPLAEWNDRMKELK